MEILKLLFPFFLFLSHCIFVAAGPACPASRCLRSGPTVRFPFRLTNKNQPGSCGYPGFNLSCGASNETTIHLQSVPFIVREIDYEAQQITINDPDCLPGKILSLNLPATPFRGPFYKEFSFFSCSSGRHQPELQPISCLSNSTRSVFATSSSPTVRSDLFGSCDVVKTVYVPVQSPSFGEEVSPSVLFQDLVLRWDSPDCRYCEMHGGRCGLGEGSGLEVDCFFDDDPNLYPVYGLFGSFAVSCVIVCGIARMWNHIKKLCGRMWNHIKKLCGRMRDRIKKLCGTSDSSEEPNPITTNHPELDIALDLWTAGSGTESEVGDSGRLSNPDGPECPICLSGFNPSEIRKTLNPCQHSFHARCIDGWLLQKATCLVCRAVCRHTIVTVA